MRLFVGLGNPGAKYAANRHNIGFMAVEAIARRHGFAPWRRRFQGETSEGTLDHERVVLLKPTTYMNESGRAVQEAANFFKIAAGDVTVFQDAAGQGKGAVDTALKLARGEAVDKKVYIPFQLVTPANMDQFTSKN